MVLSARGADTELEGDIAVYHGGDLDAARRQFPDTPTPWLDLSTGINPVPYPIDTISPAALARLPEPAALARLQSAAGRTYGAKTEAHVVCTPGSQAAIQWLPRLVNARRVAILGFGYQEYPAIWRAAGADAIVTETLDGLVQPGVDLAIVVNPNNPDGRLVDAHALLDVATQMARRGGLLVVDEAFVDVMRPNTSLVPHLPERGALILRSFGKTYGLAGLRLGFAVSGLDLADRFRAALGPWPVSGPAIEIGVLALGNDAWRAQAISRLEKDALRLDALLTKASFEILGGTPLFRLAKHARAPQWFETLARRGILTRPFPERREWLRFSMPGDEVNWARLTDALCAGPRQPSGAMT